MRIGIDFDNTIVDYVPAFRHIAAGAGLIEAGFSGGKLALRESVRARLGEPTWMRLQAAVYGRGITEAPVYDGFFDFLKRARAAGARLCIVSHKTEFAAAELSGPNLRDAARNWLTRHGVFERGIESAAVYFEGTREAKIDRISALDFTHFIDDLPEVFLEPAFPARTSRILFSACDAGPGPYRLARTWREVGNVIFDDE